MVSSSREGKSRRQPAAIQVLLADAHEAFRGSLRAFLEREGFTVVGEASDGQQALKLARDLHPDVAVLDVALPVLSGLETARKMPLASSTTKTILLTVHSEIQYILEAFRAGVAGYVIKRRASDELIKAIQETSLGGTYLCTIVRTTLVREWLAKTGAPQSQ